MLTILEVEYYINMISTGLMVKEVSGVKGSFPVIFKQPSAQDLILADFVYNKAFKDAVSIGLLTIEQMEKLLLEKGIISKELDEEIEAVREKIKAQKKVLEKLGKVKVNRERLERIIASLESKLDELLEKRHGKFGVTADSKAREAKLLFLCQRNVFRDIEVPVWKTEEEFNSETDILLRTTILNEYAQFVSGLPSKIIRYIARHNLWRTRYVSSLRCGIQLFSVPAVDFSIDMTNLLYWSHFYQNIYDMAPEDQPSDEIIEDDDALDAYMLSYYNERKNEAIARRGTKSNSLDAFDKEEVIVTPSFEYHKDIVYDKPKEAALIKDKVAVKKKGRRIR